MHSHVPAAIPEQPLYQWCPDPRGDGRGDFFLLLRTSTTTEHFPVKLLKIKSKVDLGATLLAAIIVPVKPLLHKALMTSCVFLRMTMVTRRRQKQRLEASPSF